MRKVVYHWHSAQHQLQRGAESKLQCSTTRAPVQTPVLQYFAQQRTEEAENCTGGTHLDGLRREREAHQDAKDARQHVDGAHLHEAMASLHPKAKPEEYRHVQKVMQHPCMEVDWRDDTPELAIRYGTHAVAGSHSHEHICGWAEQWVGAERTGAEEGPESNQSVVALGVGFALRASAILVELQHEDRCADGKGQRHEEGDGLGLWPKCRALDLLLSSAGLPEDVISC
mmetsp:Transcript_35581/g.82613  ORF Transcript_35581/g.82613 Transcript_35581/m.82613 type:complete len:228 (+) Transcript_35581:601-1284(+)